MALLLGLDIGTSAIKGVIINQEGTILTTEKAENQYDDSDTSIIQFSVEKRYNALLQVIHRLCEKTKPYGTIAALSMTGASGSLITLDKQNVPTNPGISWMDQRFNQSNQALPPSITPSEIYYKTGWPWSGSFPLAQLLWKKKHTPNEFKLIHKITMDPDYFIYKLCNEFWIDYSSATNSYLFNQNTENWDDALLNHIDCDTSMMSQLNASGTTIGTITPECAAQTGLSTSTQCVLGSFDHPAAARASGVLVPGDFLISCGTSWVGFYPIVDRTDGLNANFLIDPFLHPTGPWGTLFSLPKIGPKIEQLLRHLFHQYPKSSSPPLQKTDPAEIYHRFNIEAEKAAPAQLHCLIPIEKNTSTLIPLVQSCTNKYTNAEICRGIMESTAYQMRYKMETAENHNMRADSIAMVGGPAENNIWSQIIANVLATPIHLYSGQHAGALGAAILAGIGLGIFKNEKEGFQAMGGIPLIIHPQEQLLSIYTNAYEHYTSLNIN